MPADADRQGVRPPCVLPAGTLALLTSPHLLTVATGNTKFLLFNMLFLAPPARSHKKDIFYDRKRDTGRTLNWSTQHNTQARR